VAAGIWEKQLDTSGKSRAFFHSSEIRLTPVAPRNSGPVGCDCGRKSSPAIETALARRKRTIACTWPNRAREPRAQQGITT
jgi:hypothetical protein